MTTLPIRIFNWIKRFRHRCGYGVHSPSDFFLITSVIYEKYPYYAYKGLKKQKFEKSEKYRIKVYQLLFRLINYYRPKSVVDIANDGDRSLAYMKAATGNISFCSYNYINSEADLKELDRLLDKKGIVDCVHIGFTPYYKEILNMVIDRVNENSIIIIGSPYSDSKKRAWWGEIKKDERAVLTYDLYDIGIIRFPLKRYKQNYIVNFL